MTLMKPFLIILSIMMLIIGIIFLCFYLKKRKQEKELDTKESKNHQLNRNLAIIIIGGSLLVGSFIFLIY